MKLSRLVAFLNHLDNINVGNATLALGQCLDPTLHSVTTHELQFGDHSRRLQRIKSNINDSLREFHSVIDELKADIRSNIESLEPHYLRESYRLYNQEMKNDSTQLMLGRRPSLSPETESYIRSRISRHGDWRYPGLIIRPGLESWVRDLVALDPMYIADVNHDMLEPFLSSFTEEYRNRVRSYIIRETTDFPMLSNLPQNQMAFVLVYNYFNFKPLEIIRQFLQEIFDCMKPGGVLAFTFNNCDRSGGVDLAERYFMCYTPGRLLLTATELVGFEMVHTYDIDAAATWVELKKPGELTSHRGGQALARIVPIASRKK